MTSSSLISRINEAKSTWPVASFLKISINFIKDSVSIKAHLLVHLQQFPHLDSKQLPQFTPDSCSLILLMTAIRNNLIENQIRIRVTKTSSNKCVRAASYVLKITVFRQGPALILQEIVISITGRNHGYYFHWLISIC
jgi:hypothetical protein